MAPLASPEATCCSSCSMRDLSSIAEVGLADGFVALHIQSLARHDDPPGLQHVGIVGWLECQRRILLNQEHAHLGLCVDAPHDAENLLDDERSKTEGWLVQQHQTRSQHERAADRQHLLLAARQSAGLLIEARLQDWEV